MDNFLQVLIFLVIIYSIFANVLSKKKSEKQRTEIPDNAQRGEPDDSSPQYSRDDIFGDIFGSRLPNNQRKSLPEEPLTSAEPEVQADVENIQPELYSNFFQQPVNLSQPMIVDLMLTNRRTLELKEKKDSPAAEKN
jgi:hypothetical protein